MEEVGLAKGGGRVVGWSRDGAHRAGSPGKGSAKNGHGPDRAPPPCVNRNQVSGRNCFLKKRIQQICRKMVSFAL